MVRIGYQQNELLVVDRPTSFDLANSHGISRYAYDSIRLTYRTLHWLYSNGANVVLLLEEISLNIHAGYHWFSFRKTKLHSKRLPPPLRYPLLNTRHQYQECHVEQPEKFWKKNKLISPAGRKGRSILFHVAFAIENTDWIRYIRVHLLLHRRHLFAFAVY